MSIGRPARVRSPDIWFPKHWIVYVVPVLQPPCALVLTGLGYKIGDLWVWLAWLMKILGMIILAVGAVYFLRAWLTRRATGLAVTNRKVERIETSCRA
jgi:hypothetical protein